MSISRGPGGGFALAVGDAGAAELFARAVTGAGTPGRGDGARGSARADAVGEAVCACATDGAGTGGVGSSLGSDGEPAALVTSGWGMPSAGVEVGALTLVT